jgi:hypothetical protein
MQADLSQRRRYLQDELDKPKPDGDGAPPANTIAAKPSKP